MMGPWHVPRAKKKENDMKRTLTLASSILLLAAPLAHAENDAYDCFPGCPYAVPVIPAQKTIDLCEIGAVRDAARINDQLKPVKEIYDIAVNPTGFAVKMVDEHVVHIPKWVGYAMDPKGAAKSYVINYVRTQAKKQVGLQDECRAAPPAIDESDGLHMEPVAVAHAA
jgi:hypothetical protein